MGVVLGGQEPVLAVKEARKVRTNCHGSRDLRHGSSTTDAAGFVALRLNGLSGLIG